MTGRSIPQLGRKKNGLREISSRFHQALAEPANAYDIAARAYGHIYSGFVNDSDQTVMIASSTDEGKTRSESPAAR
jgi:hypothetical protein